MTPLEAALKYRALGLKPIPIKPRSKVPALANWPELDPWADDFEDRFADPARGVGLALGGQGAEWLFAIDIDGDSHGVDGEESWREVLADAGADEPTTWEAITGGGGRHLVFRSNVEIRNGDTVGLPGVDTRGAGGQILVEPTYHPDTGAQYQWIEGQEPWSRHVADAPPWLIERLTANRGDNTNAIPANVTSSRISLEAPSGERPGDAYASAHSWAEILEADGWTLHHTDQTGETYWTRPGKERREGWSATAGYGGGDTLKVFTSSVPGLTPEATYTPIGYVAATKHHGDFKAAAKELQERGYGAPPAGPAQTIGAPVSPEVPIAVVDEGWPIATAEDMAAVLNGSWEPPKPTVGHRSDDACLFYAGKVHSVSGEPGGAKTWVSLHVIAQEIAKGKPSLFIDHEDRLDTAVRRLHQLGVPQVQIVEYFRYVTPTFAIRGGGVPANVIEAADGASVVVIDSMGEALAHDGLSQNDDGEVATWMAQVARRLADQGAAVIILDHVVKDSESQGRWAIGSQRKLAAIDGAAYTVRVGKSLSREQDGEVYIKVAKDRGGNYQHGSTAADVTLTNGEGGALVISMHPPKAASTSEETGRPRLTGYMEKVSKFIESCGSAPSKNQIIRGISGKREYVESALTSLVDEGFVRIETGARNAILVHLVRPFFEIERPQPTSARPQPDLSPGGGQPESTSAQNQGAPRRGAPAGLRSDDNAHGGSKTSDLSPTAKPQRLIPELEDLL